ncbi:MAG: hypothetical protein RMJ04_10935 [Geminicoccaceae bacterium]|nr:hypothetical protein [Geminicoccaceae bacterium]
MSAPILAIGLDAFELDRVQRLAGGGRAPVLARLLRRGRLIPLRGECPDVVLEPWHGFVADAPLGAHGRFHLKEWDAKAGRFRLASDWHEMPRAFWWELAARGLRIAILDVPFAPDPTREQATIALAGWQVHDLGPRGSRPAGYFDELARRFGAPALGPERYGDVAPARLLEIARECREATRQFGAILCDLLARGPFDLVLAVLGTVHRAGHYLRDPGRLVVEGRIDPATAERLEDALDAVYAQADAMLGGVLEAVPPKTPLVLFALHGMGAETPWTERLPQILDFLAGGGGLARTRGWLAKLRRSPLALALARTLPRGPQDLLGRFTGRWLYDWPATRVFAVPSEGIGAVRVNLLGRDRFGIVRPGAEARALLDALEERLFGLRELATGEPVVEAVRRTEDLVGEDAPGRERLPDLLIQWRELPLERCRGLVAPDGRVLAFDTPIRASSGRTGNHRPGGFALLVDADPGPLSGPAGASVRDLPKFLCALATARKDRSASAPARLDA